MLGALALALSMPWTARAGDRPLEVLLVNMSPDGTDPDCMRDITRVIRHDDATIHRMGGDRARDLAGHGRDDTHFTTWAAEDLDAVVRLVRAEQVDAVALVDCRAEEGRADAWVRSPNGGVARIRLSGTVIDTERAEWLARGILAQARTGFSP